MTAKIGSSMQTTASFCMCGALELRPGSALADYDFVARLGDHHLAGFQAGHDFDGVLIEVAAQFDDALGDQSVFSDEDAVDAGEIHDGAYWHGESLRLRIHSHGAFGERTGAENVI